MPVSIHLTSCCVPRKWCQLPINSCPCSADGYPGIIYEPNWDRLLFSAKESVYKTWFPLTRRWLGFESADVVIDASAGTFTVRLLVPGALVNGSPLTLLHGRWLSCQGLLLTTIVVPAVLRRATGPDPH
jgi:hypothetical protein